MLHYKLQQIILVLIYSKKTLVNSNYTNLNIYSRKEFFREMSNR